MRRIDSQHARPLCLYVFMITTHGLPVCAYIIFVFSYIKLVPRTNQVTISAWSLTITRTSLRKVCAQPATSTIINKSCVASVRKVRARPEISTASNISVSLSTFQCSDRSEISGVFVSGAVLILLSWESCYTNIGLFFFFFCRNKRLKIIHLVIFRWKLMKNGT